MTTTETNAGERALLAEVDRLQPDVVDLTSRLVQIRSVNPRYPGVDYERELGGESRCNQLLEPVLAALGLETHRFAREPGRENLCATLRGTGEGKSLVFNGHVDTVAAVNLDTWHHDPWSGRVEDGTVFGLGATDMKGAIAASVIAVRALVNTGVPLRGDVILQCAIGEESSEYEIGTRACVEEGFTGDAGICMEPTRQFVNDQLTLALAPVSLGTLVMRITVKGLTVHAGRRREVLYPTGAPRPGVSAFEKGLLLVSALARLENNWVFTKRSPFYPRGQFVLNPGVVRAEPHGTGSAFFVPDTFTAEYVIYYPPEEDREAVREEIVNCLKAASEQDEWLVEQPPRIEWLPSFPPSTSGTDHQLFADMTAVIETVTGTPAHIQGIACGCDATFLHEAGMHAVIYGPGDLSNAHRPNESVSVDELVEAAKVYALSALRFCR